MKHKVSKKELIFLILFFCLIIFFSLRPASLENVNLKKHPELSGINIQKKYEDILIKFSNDENCSTTHECDVYSKINNFAEEKNNQ